MPRAFYNKNTGTDESDVSDEGENNVMMEELTLSKCINSMDTSGDNVSRVSDVDKPDSAMVRATLDNRHFWNELKIIKGNLENMDKDLMHSFVAASMSSEIVELKKAFSSEFGNVPDTDIYKTEIVKLMESLGISVAE